MTRTGFRQMGVNSTYLARHQRKGVRGDLIKRLAELIKNADDAYDRLELDNKQTSGIIEIAYDKIKTRSGKGYSIKGFFIRDFGSGMSAETAKEAYYGEKNYGSDTSGETRNGAIGVGGKDAFIDMKDCFVLTVHNGTLTVIEIQTSKDGTLASDVIEGNDTELILKEANNHITKSGLEPITLEKNQTMAMFRLPDSEQGVNPTKLAEQLTHFSTLRWILESETRTVKLTDLSFAKTLILQHSPLEGELLFEKKITLSFNSIPYDVMIEFRKADHDLDHNKNYGYGILIETGRGAILDNQMYGYGDESAASRIFGKIIFCDWKKLYRDSGGEILTENREGLDYHHKVNTVLEQHIKTNLKPLIEIEKSKQANNPELDKKLDSNLKRAFALINKILLKDPNLGIEVEEIPETPPEGIAFASDSYTFTPNITKQISLLINPGKVPTSSDISLQVIGKGITIQPDSLLTSSTYDNEKVPFVKIDVTGKELVNGKKTRTTIKAFFGDLEAETEIYIIPETDRQPQNGFAFTPKKIKLVPKKQRKIKLVIDTNLIPSGTPIVLTCEDDRVTFSPKKLTVTNPPNLGKHLTEEIITISCDVVGLKTKLQGETKTNNGESRLAFCELEVKEKQPPKQFFKDYEADATGDKRVRSRFRKDEGIIYIHINAPILKRVFGPGAKHIKSHLTDEAVTLLADTIVNRMTLELAKHYIETGKIDVLDDEQTAIERQKADFEMRFGLDLFETIRSGAAKHDSDENN